jgi:hypothetical protein
MIFERFSDENTGINDMDHDYNTQIQGCTSEYPRVYGVGAFRVQTVTLDWFSDLLIGTTAGRFIVHSFARYTCSSYIIIDSLSKVK